MTNNKVAEIKAPHAIATTTAPSGTFQEFEVAPGDGVLMYWPEQNGFLALFPDEYREFYVEADEHSKKIAALQAAKRQVMEASIALRQAHKSGVAANIQRAQAKQEAALDECQRASEEVKKKLEPLSPMDAKKGVKLVELVSLRTPKYQEKVVPIYVKSTKLDKILSDKRVYLMSGEATKRPKEKIFKNGKLDTKEIKNRFADQVHDKGFSKKWKLKPDDADAYTGILTEWAKTMNGQISTFLERLEDNVEKTLKIDPKDPQRVVDLSAEAQLMRYTAGAGLAANFKPFRGDLFDSADRSLLSRGKRVLSSGEMDLKANAEASFAIAEARVRTALYLPHFAGWHASAAIGSEYFELGYWRFCGEMILSGCAGASLAVELDIGLSYTEGKQAIRGVSVLLKQRRALGLRASAGAELNVFAGVRAGVDFVGALQWLNPEGADSKTKGGTLKPSAAVAEFKNMATVQHGAAYGVGIGLTGAFRFGHEDGKFIVYAKLGACVGRGGDVSARFEAKTDTIYEYFKCLAYQLKRADFHKIKDAIDTIAYEAFAKVSYLVVAKGRDLSDYAEQTLDRINMEYKTTIKEIDTAIKQGSDGIQSFMQRLHEELQKRSGGWFNYLPSETLGQLMRQMYEAEKVPQFANQAPQLMALMTEPLQTINHLQTVAQRMTSVIGEKQNEMTGFAMIDACVDGTAFAGCVERTRKRLEGAYTLASAPFIWNSDAQFITAKLGIEHPMYA